MTTHPTIAFALDLADKLIKLAAVLLAGLWTYWNYRKSRTYEQKLGLELTGDVFFRIDLFIDVSLVLRNTGASKFTVQPEGTLCEIIAVMDDLSTREIRLFEVFRLHDQIEPAESINDHVLWRIADPDPRIIWLRVNLRVVSGRVEWNATSIVRVEKHPVSVNVVKEEAK